MERIQPQVGAPGQEEEEVEEGGEQRGGRQLERGKREQWQEESEEVPGRQHDRPRDKEQRQDDRIHAILERIQVMQPDYKQR